MNKLPSIIAALFLLTLGALAQVPTNRISLTISITNAPVTSNTLVVNADTRTWTNASTASTILTNLISTAQSATNLYNQIANFPYSGGIFPQWLTETSIVLRAPLGGALSASQSGDWAILTLSTQSGPLTFTALWPLENMPTATNRTNQGSAFVYGLSTFSTQAFATNSTAVSNLLQKGIGPLQRVQSEVRFDGRTAVSSNFFATNGFTANMTNINPVNTNLVNYGNAIRSEGSGGNSLQVGSNSFALGTFALSIGNSAIAASDDAVAIGTSSLASNNYAMAIGNGAMATNTDTLALGRASAARSTSSMAIGQAADASAPYSISIGGGSEASGGASMSLGSGAVSGGTNATALGVSSSAVYNRSTAIGYNSTTTTTNQIRLGTSAETISIPGIVEISGTQTNTTFTGTNVLNGRVDATPRNNTALANGYNSAVVFGTNLVVRFSGPSGAYTNAGFLAPGGPQIVWGHFDNPGLSFTLLDESGLDVTAANRIITGTGALLNSTNRVVIAGFIYDTTASRWRIISFR